MSIRLVIADDQGTVRESLAIVLGLVDGFEVVATAQDGGQAVDAVAEHDPDVIVMDLHMPGVDGVEATRRIAAQHPRTKVVVLTTYADDRSVLDALQAGALGYLTKDAGREQIAQAVRTAAAGQAVLDPVVHQQLITAASSGQNPPGRHPAAGNSRTAALPDGLTHREAEVLALIAQGLSNTEIATRLVLSPATVKTHINNLFAKISVKDRAQAVRYAYRNKLLAGEK